MPESFGARMRQRREERQIDLIAIAGQTKIKLALLEALERDDVSQWPAGIFRRAYIRTYAQMIGLDPDATLREFVDLYPDPGDTFTALGPAGAPDDAVATTAGPPTRLRTIVESAIDSLARLRRPSAGEATARPTVPLNPPAPDAGDVRPALPRPSPTEEVEAIQAAVPVTDAKKETAHVLEVAPPETVSDVKPAAARDIQASHDDTLETVADLCTELGRASDRGEVQLLLQNAANVLHASGLIVWNWDPIPEDLRPALVHGYSEKVVSHLPAVTREGDNATAAAFRTASPCEVAATAHTSAALVVPLLMPDGCTGVLAIELQPGIQPTRSLRSVAVLVAAALSQLMQRSRRDESRPPIERAVPVVATFRSPARPVKVRR